MAGEDGKGDADAPGKPDEGSVKKTIDRRDVLWGLSTLPALGLFGYAWSKERGYERVQRAAASAGEAAAATGQSELNVGLLGVGAQGEVLLDAMLRMRGLRFRAVCDIWKEYNQSARSTSCGSTSSRSTGTKTTGRCSTRRRTSTRS
jgi:hypothetical protein